MHPDFRAAERFFPTESYKCCVCGCESDSDYGEFSDGDKICTPCMAINDMENGACVGVMLGNYQRETDERASYFRREVRVVRVQDGALVMKRHIVNYRLAAIFMERTFVRYQGLMHVRNDVVCDKRLGNRVASMLMN